MLRRELFLFLRISFQIFFKKSKRTPLYFFLKFFFRAQLFFLLIKFKIPKK